ncbi:hypothetical protein BDP81DRAFT_312517 [Colletotrichum phormii]|uniref:CRIB domain-containing protein n=1 Tax=Colletotrichum phormii TaxID=359342 RepID=A0AAJ0A1E0_9PEZI|nr:uncharacterized protein BDP81DRAFT_312517 [Colletotrichum phormii]KAK1640337.1 hypothetical protein BDP81DRAFT_312517 [Colletotrichum phormii]
MWATAPLPYYSAYKPTRRKERASISNKGGSSPSAVNGSEPPLPLLSTQDHPDNITDLFEPALDGPPSPERIRALSKQMQRASALDKRKSHTTTSSGSTSSLRSLNSDRSWEHTLETITLSRRSSGRSTSSSMPSKDRPESVQLFGKTIFNRRAKMKRESSGNHSSSGSSLYSGELVLDGPASTNKDHFIPSIFGRRRTLRQDDLGEDPVSGRKLQISGPYNFQHVTHTKKDHLPDLQRGSRAELVSEFSAIRAGQRPTTGQLKGIDVEDLHFSNFSSEALHTQQDNAMTSETQPEIEEVVSPTLPGSPVPVPPPRSSSRIMKHCTVSEDSLATIDMFPERPQTSSGFHLPGTLEAPIEFTESTISEEAEPFEDPRFSHAITTPDDAAWPLTASSTVSYEMALPDVPEEEEQFVLSRQSGASLASTRSSLRGSQSVPALRPSVPQTPEDEFRRPSSGASDTLGSFDMLAAQNALKEALEVDGPASVSHRASWEDDIDYCYEHEAEADCDYAWDRPSLDIAREDSVETSFDNDGIFVAPLSAGLKPASTMGHSDIPALSPASQTSVNGHEAITPTITAPPESHGFNLSPSLLIPTDFRQQMLADSDTDAYPMDVARLDTSHFAFDEEPVLTIETPGLLTEARHTSTNSTWTALTRYTGSTTFEGWNPKFEGSDHSRSFSADDFADLGSPRARKSTMTPLPESEEVLTMSRSTGDIRAASGCIDASLSRDSLPLAKTKEPVKQHRRQRAQTLSAPPPPGQYALFPPIYAGSRI